MNCLACYRDIGENTAACPTCGYQYYYLPGDDDLAVQALSFTAGRHRAFFLSRFRFGFTRYTWKDIGGKLALSGQRWISFGTGNELYGNSIWHNEVFARFPGKESLCLDIQVNRDNMPWRTLQIRIAQPQEQLPLKLGCEMREDLSIVLLLSNGQTQTRSNPISFLDDMS